MSTGADIIQIDVKGFKKQALVFANKYNREFVAIMRDQHRLWTNDLIKKTPPKTLSEGRKAVKRDLNKIFVSIDDRNVLAFFKDDIQSSGKIPRSVIYNLNGSPTRMKWQHERYRTGPRKNVRFKSSTVMRFGDMDLVNEMYVPRAAFNKFLNEKYSHVGQLKAGWVPAAVHFGGKFPAFAGKQTKKLGGFSDSLKNNGRGALVSINKVPWAPSRLLQLLRATAKTRERDLHKQAHKRLKVLADAENRKAA